MRVVRISIASFFLVLFWTQIVLCAPLDDVPGTHWAKQAVRYLSDRGLLEGYDGGFLGERQTTRYQMAELLARVLKRLEAMPAPSLENALTAQDLEVLKGLLQQYRIELRSVEPDLRKWEEMLARWDLIVTEAERVRTYGSLQIAGVNQDVVGEDSSLGAPSNPALDFTTGRLLAKGSVLTGVARLGVRGRLAEGMDGGVEFTATGQVGSLAVATYWGVTPPYFQNPFAGFAAGNGAGIDNVWVSHGPSNTAFFAGAFLPKTIKGHLLQGEPNPIASGPQQLPLGGLDLVGTISGKIPVTVEVVAARLAQGSPYSARLAGFQATGYLPKGSLGLAFIRASNSGGGAQGQIPLPGNPWQGKGGLQAGAGPQEEDLWGLEWNHTLSPKLSLRVEFGASRYVPDRSGWMYDDRAEGRLLRGTLSGQAGDFQWGVQFLSVDAAYDPFLLPYPVPPNIPVLVPYSTYYANYYQLHDSREFPNNRQGIRLNVTYPTRKGEIRGTVESLTQKDPSTAQNITRPGMVESLFPAMVASDSVGKIESSGLIWTHSLSSAVVLSTSLLHYEIVRESALRADRMSLIQDNGILRLEWSPEETWKVFGGYQQIHYRGDAGIGSLDMIQWTPSLGARYALSPAASAEISFRWFTFQNRTLPQGNWHGTQSTLRLESRF
ncbi:MAG: S-layer homology domain-containing protein [Armatimonadetes bacterium]|nr:S-layer homology domain-containing protein [Armatimonadota bacterium]